MRKALLAFVVLAVAAPALAATLDPGTPLASAPVSIGSPRAAQIVYSAKTPAFGFWDAPGADIGDDLNLTSAGVLDSVEFSVYNGDAAGLPITTADLTVSFYSYDGVNTTYINGLVFANANLALPAGYYTTLTATNLASFAINLPAGIMASLKISNVTGGATRVGQVSGGTPTLGTSQDLLWQDGVWYPAPFGPGYLGNAYWEIGIVPEPASLLLIAAGLLVIRRR